MIWTAYYNIKKCALMNKKYGDELNRPLNTEYGTVIRYSFI